MARALQIAITFAVLTVASVAVADVAPPDPNCGRRTDGSDCTVDGGAGTCELATCYVGNHTAPCATCVPKPPSKDTGGCGVATPARGGGALALVGALPWLVRRRRAGIAKAKSSPR